MKRVISLFMAVVMAFTMSVTGFAAESNSYNVIQDDAAVATIVSCLTGGLTVSQAATTATVAVSDVVALDNAIKDCQRVWQLYVQ